ncbi:uncharacterized protein B0I36DRAFT_321312 [Microdochium trichocladiopsis]|uniref:Ubiquitin-like domain-containing protein n=1 Tax=Microdochium trichocladiopsis TaxID=1682393 RepID=A0A9P8Y737_9PEZI|nr:uncharacterized protein B0I36DRAFT_321312 [Microdochium trichocladiopsis]KAH7033375.1 hypothetical protein B0I36DRAFT_321312 [Microdochium trichocladiopsis]
MAAASPQGAESTMTAPESLDLQIMSPSAGVPQPWLIRGIPTNTSVRQLKERLRNVLAARPADNAQRLIHRGRLLARDDDTLLDVFGVDAIRSAEHQTLHLVLREPMDAQPAPALNPAASGAAPDNAPPQGHATAQMPAFGPQPVGVNGNQTQAQPANNVHNQPLPQHNIPFGVAPQVQVRIGHGPWPPIPTIPHAPASGVPHLPMHGMPPVGQAAGLPPGYTPQQFAQHQLQWMATMNAQMGQRRMEELLAQNRGRQGPHTAHEGIIPGATGSPAPAASVRTSSPYQQDATRTVIREGVGPNGQQWRVVMNETVPNPLMRNARTSSPFSRPDMQHGFQPPGASNNVPQQPRSVPPSGGPFTGNDVQSILHQADVNQATRTLTDAMRRNASTSSLATLASNHSAHPIPPGVTVPSRTASAAGTPDPLRAAGFTRPMFAVPPPPLPQAAPAARNPEVYILSSPSGPRALLVNSDQQTYYTPQGRRASPFAGGAGIAAALSPFSGAIPTPLTQQVGNPFAPAAHGTPGPQTPHVQNDQLQGLPGAAVPQQAAPQLDNVVAQAGVAQPGVQAQEIRMIPIWPHVWMIIRLVLFVWWFTTPESSWSRWITVISIAVGLFLANTGILNPLIEQFWVPLRGHIENLMPLADNHGRPRPARNPVGGADANGNVGRAREPNPADTAARLVEQRRNANANWLLDIVRRLERAGLIFLASIAPGIAERHIEHLEAEARAERQRVEAEAAAAAEAAQTAAQAPPDAQESTEQVSGDSEAPDTDAQPEDAAGASNDFQPASASAGEVRQRPVHATDEQ